jgi:hypothetical protein
MTFDAVAQQVGGARIVLLLKISQAAPEVIGLMRIQA